MGIGRIRGKQSCQTESDRKTEEKLTKQRKSVFNLVSGGEEKQLILISGCVHIRYLYTQKKK